MTQTIIPSEFERYLLDKITAGGAPNMNEFVFAYIPDLDPEIPIARTQGLPDEAYVVHRQSVDQVARLNSNTLVYSVILLATTASFTFNAIYLHDKHVANSCGLIVHKSTETKEANMTATKSVAQEYSGAAAIANIHIDPATWQIDFHARLTGMDDDLHLANRDHYGNTAFITGCSVVKQAEPNTYTVNSGVVYVSGLRVALPQTQVVVSAKPCGLYLDVVRHGSALSRWENTATVRSSESELNDYIDEYGHKHYIARLAGIDTSGAVSDWRVWEVITQQQAEAGESELRSLWSAKRVFQAVASYINKNINSATQSVAGWMSAADKKKLDGIEAEAQVNVATNLGATGNANTQTVTSSTGSNATLPAATTSKAGVMTAGDKSKLNGIQAGAQVNVATNLGATGNANTQTVTSSTGSNATLPAATTSKAGVMTASDKSKLNGIAVGATKNQSDAHLKNRANHTGTQAISSVSGLQTALNNKVNVGDAVSGTVYSGTANKNTQFPVGAYLIAWVGSTYYRQGYVNRHTTLYVVSSNSGDHARYGSSLYGNYKGASVAGTWAFRGYVYAMANVQTGLFQRVL
ncbi:tail-collar fiber protein [Vibrio sp. ES.051]|uniref:phage tail protein n=1 Tax=Vibrio sp. ES.051 TaxID=1761909 RepID=UPI000BF3CF0C|nr:phage tail protein [Vibrio sp. ES.051]PFG55752.1 tail-collar fiber protein [Vibrio sp. ES.051]